MDEQLIRQQTAVLLDAYRELTGSKEIPGIEGFLKLRATAIREGGMSLRGDSDSTFIEKPTIRGSSTASKAAPPLTQTNVLRVEIPHVEQERKPVIDIQSPQPDKTRKQVIEPEPQKEEELFKETPSMSDAFAMLRSIQDPWNGQ